MTPVEDDGVVMQCLVFRGHAGVRQYDTPSTDLANRSRVGANGDRMTGHPITRARCAVLAAPSHSRRSAAIILEVITQRARHR